MTRIALYPGSFDPPTRGHEDLIRRSLLLADRVIVAVAVNAVKQPLFSPAERVDMLRLTVGTDPRITFESFEGLVADFARRVGAGILLRGLRAVGDFEYEFQMALMNRKLHPDLETVFLMPKEEFSVLSSRMVREVGMMGGDITGFVPEPVRERIAARLRNPGDYA